MTFRVLLVGPTPESLARLSAGLPPQRGSIQISQQTGGADVLAVSIQRGEIDLAVAQLTSVSESALAAIEQALHLQPRTTLVLVSDDQSSEFLLRAMRAGVRELVPSGATDDSLAKAIERQFDRHKATAATGPVRRASTIAFLSPKGGGGATFLATNLGFALRKRERRVALLDLNLQFGDAALFVSERAAERSIADVAREISRLDPAFLEANMIRPQSDYFVLPAPESPERAGEVGPETIERIFDVARGRYDFVIVDLGRVLDRVTVRALDEADMICVVVQSTLPYLHNAKRLLGVLSGLGYERNKLRVLLNRHVKNDEIGVGEIEKTLGLPVSLQVPNSYEAVAYSINHGLSLLEHAPRDPVARTLSRFAAQLAPEPQRRRGWLRSVLGGR